MKDRELARRLERSNQSKDIPLPSLPGYSEWSSQYQDRFPVAIEWMDEQCTWMHPDEVDGDHTELFEEMFQDILAELGELPDHEDGTAPQHENFADSRNEAREKEQAQKNLEAWLDAGGAEEFVANCRGRWTDRDWEKLLDSLKTTRYWPIDGNRVGEELEKATRRYEQR